MDSRLCPNASGEIKCTKVGLVDGPDGSGSVVPSLVIAATSGIRQEPGESRLPHLIFETENLKAFLFPFFAAPKILKARVIISL